MGTCIFCAEERYKLPESQTQPMPRHWVKTSVKPKQGWEPGGDKGVKASMPSSFPPHSSLDPKPCLPSPWGGGKLAEGAPVSSACNGPEVWAGTSIKHSLKLEVQLGEGGEAQVIVGPCVHWEQQDMALGCAKSSCHSCLIWHCV